MSKRHTVDNDDECVWSGWPRNETNPFCISNIDVSNFLNLHSKENHEHFCLSYVFTYRSVVSLVFTYEFRYGRYRYFSFSTGRSNSSQYFPNVILI